MNTKCHYGRRSQQRRRRRQSAFKHNPQTSNDFGEVFSNFYVHKLDKILRTDLHNFYRHDQENGVIHCLICERNINKNDAFEHIVSSGHKLNKLFYDFVQKRKQIGDVNYIVTPKWAKCRYCSNVRIPAAFTEERTSHIHSSMHSTKKQYCLNRVGGDAHSPAFVRPAAQTSQSWVKSVAEPLVLNNENLSNKCQSVAGPSGERSIKRTDVNEVQNINGLDKRQHSLRSIDKDVAIEQDVSKCQYQDIDVSARRSSVRKSTALLKQYKGADRFRVNEGRQLLAAEPEKEVNATKEKVVSQQPAPHISQFCEYQICFQNSNNESHCNRPLEAEPVSWWQSIFSCCFPCLGNH